MVHVSLMLILNCICARAERSALHVETAAGTRLCMIRLLHKTGT